MTSPPKKRNPLSPLRAPKPLPSARSRAALGLAVGAAEGRFRLQICVDCGAVQYPPRELCVGCLGALRWRDVEPRGTLVAQTTTRISSEPWFRERPPWLSGIVELACGPKLVAHLHPDCAAGDAVNLSLKLDPAGRGAVYAAPDEAGEDEQARRAFSADPGDRNVLIVDGRASTAPALARALEEAGAAHIYVGLSERWRPAPSFEGCEIVALDVSDSQSSSDLAALIGDKVDILINNCDHFRAAASDAANARLAFEIHALGAMRLAAAFGPVLRARTGEAGRSSAAFVTIISALALLGSREHAAYAAAQAALRSINQTLRAESRAYQLRVVDVLTGPIDDEWRQAIRPPKVAPAALAAALVAALRGGLEEVVVGDVAREIHTKWAEDPRLLRQETP
jgi:NAD(P)-dependent dehydrogenase (short-subunit alcohol dehydrogenase family)/uncharacterized OB-fold protein